MSTTFGAEGQSIDVDGSLLVQYGLVFAIGRTTILAAACGVLSLVAEIHGSDGLLGHCGHCRSGCWLDQVAFDPTATLETFSSGVFRWQDESGANAPLPSPSWYSAQFDAPRAIAGAGSVATIGGVAMEFARCAAAAP
jgi:hypothetical protein